MFRGTYSLLCAQLRYVAHSELSRPITVVGGPATAIEGT